MPLLPVGTDLAERYKVNVVVPGPSHASIVKFSCVDLVQQLIPEPEPESRRARSRKVLSEVFGFTLRML